MKDIAMRKIDLSTVEDEPKVPTDIVEEEADDNEFEDDEDDDEDDDEEEDSEVEEA
jgi:hypothetical protein